jgi:acyl-CoA reductase-like NAD-dependent aldehyde dehydrogenase
MKRYQMLIGGEWVDAEARENFETENPFLGAAWAFVPRAKRADVDHAVEAARKAFRAPSWAKISATARCSASSLISSPLKPVGWRRLRHATTAS